MSVVGSRDAARGAATVEELKADGDVRLVELDVVDAWSVRAAATWLDGDFGRLDVLVNNAGISGGLRRADGRAGRPDAVRAVFENNVFGAVAVTEAVLPLLRRSAAARGRQRD